jgi:hypothetical protein
MCFGRPSPPPAPAPEPVDSPIEETADAVVIGDQQKKKKSEAKGAMVRRLGTRSLQIPLLGGMAQYGVNNIKRGGDLNYPT